jgi:hypothetical protein
MAFHPSPTPQNGATVVAFEKNPQQDKYYQINHDIEQWVQNALDTNNPPELRQTYQRMLATGMTPKGATIAVTTATSMVFRTTVTGSSREDLLARLVRALHRLPIIDVPAGTPL